MGDYTELNELIAQARTVVILQADNPDGDSLGSSLALEAMLSEMGKTVYMVCAIDIPSYLTYLPGWDRVTNEIPKSFDATIVVDSSTESLFEVFDGKESFAWIKAKPVIVIDHHTESTGISFANINIIENAAATSEIIYQIAMSLNWPLPIDACEMMAVSIMSDSLGLISDTTTPRSIRVVADLVELGVSLAKLDNSRRQMMLKDPKLLPYKGELLRRAEFSAGGRICSVTIPWEEIEEYSPLYNPTMLVIDDMRMIKGVEIAIGYKLYKDGKITAKIRSNYGTPIAGKLAAEFGGGGHEFASGFKISDGRKLEDIKSNVEQKTIELLQAGA